MTINGLDLKTRAIKFGALLNHPEFKASDGWLENFKKRHHIVHKSIVGEAGLVDNDLVDDWINSRLPDLIKGYSLDDTFNSDETALFYRALPEKSLQYSGINNDNVKVSKERLSILFCSNWSGNEKLKPVVIGKFKNPRCFKNINRANLPVHYRNNSNAWMDNFIFREWLAILETKFKAENRKVFIKFITDIGKKRLIFFYLKILFY